MTSGIGLPYINIAAAESAVLLVRSFDVTLCKLQVCANTNRSTGKRFSELARTPCVYDSYQHRTCRIF